MITRYRRCPIETFDIKVLVINMSSRYPISKTFDNDIEVFFTISYLRLFQVSSTVTVTGSHWHIVRPWAADSDPTTSRPGPTAADC
jgi:hypothetical protein